MIESVRPASQERVVGIEGLRAVAASAVVVYHAGQLVSRPDALGEGPLALLVVPFSAGVTLFFVLSGFLLYRPFAQAIVKEEPLPSIKRYFRNRALRILPAYWFILAVTAFALQSAVIGFSPPNLVTGALTDVGKVVRSAFFVQNYSRTSIGTGINPAWSLAIEMVFYLVLPLLALSALLAYRRIRRKSFRHWATLVPIGVLFGLGLTGKVLATYAVPGPLNSFNSGWHSVLQFSFLGHADVFAWGMAVAAFKVAYDAGLVTLPSRRARLYGEAVVLAVFAVTLFSLPASDRGLAAFFIPIPFALLLAFVVIPTGERRPSRVVRFLDSRPLVAAGLVSYSIFLWHQPLLYWLNGHHLVWYGPLGFVATLALLGVVCGVLSALTYRFVEAPALRRKSRQSAARLQMLSAAPASARPPLK